MQKESRCMPHKSGSSTTRLPHKEESSQTGGAESSAAAAAPDRSLLGNLVSVIIPAFNAEDTIEPTLESVLKQT